MSTPLFNHPPLAKESWSFTGPPVASINAIRLIIALRMANKRTRRLYCCHNTPLVVSPCDGPDLEQILILVNYGGELPSTPWVYKIGNNDTATQRANDTLCDVIKAIGDDC